MTARGGATRPAAMAAASLLVVLTVAGGCARRVPAFSPRRTVNPDHLAAETREACLDCHPVTSLARHAAGDDCFTCHPLKPGMRR